MKTLITILLSILLMSCICDDEDRDTAKNKEVIADQHIGRHSVSSDSIIISIK